MNRNIFPKILLNILLVFGMAVCISGIGMGAENFWKMNPETPDEQEESFFHRPAKPEDTGAEQFQKKSVQKQRQTHYIKTVRSLIAGDDEKEFRINEKADPSQPEDRSKEKE